MCRERRRLAVRPQFGKCGDFLRDAVIRDFEIGGMEAGDRVAVGVTSGESGLDEIRFGVENRRGRRVRMTADRNLLGRRLGAQQQSGES